jgi:uncharacterized protein (TIGR02246 family)
VRRTSVFVTIAFLVGLVVGLVARSAGLCTILQRDTHAADLTAIKKLEQEDIEVTLSQDPKGLVDVWAEDGVRFKPGTSPTIGKQAIAAENEKFRTQYPDFKVLKYVPDLKTIRIAIVDGWAIEVGSMEATYKMSANDKPVSVQDRGMRLLKRQSDGSWKFALVGLK